jgi:hypothetical protein
MCLLMVKSSAPGRDCFGRGSWRLHAQWRVALPRDRCRRRPRTGCGPNPAGTGFGYTQPPNPAERNQDNNTCLKYPAIGRKSKAESREPKSKPKSKPIPASHNRFAWRAGCARQQAKPSTVYRRAGLPRRPRTRKSTIDPRLSTFDLRLSTLDFRPSTLVSRPSTAVAMRLGHGLPQYLVQDAPDSPLTP